MKVDFSTKILSLDNAEIIDSEGAFTAKRVAIGALMAEMRDDNPAQKLDRYRLALKISQSPEADLSIDELKILQDRIRITCGALAVGRMDELLNR